jgi:Tfp pilus assembly protein PilV
MGYKLKNSGFSLTEVLLSVGVLAVGMIFIAGVFPVGIHYTTIAIEQTKAAIVADEAFAKVRLYAVGDPCESTDDFDPNRLGIGAKRGEELFDFNDSDIFPATDEIDPNEFTYPSAGTDISQKRYCWSALCRLTNDPNSNLDPLVEVTVFVCRKTGANLRYREPPNGIGRINWPRPVRISVSDVVGRDNELRITGGDERFITDGCRIVGDETGQRCRVLERYATDDDTILLDADWEGGNRAWVVPPPVNGGRNPCIAVYQRTISF